MRQQMGYATTRLMVRPLSLSGLHRSLRRGCLPCASHAPLTAALRTYYWPYPENFLPEGATTSAFQSSPVPSVRERIVREYALSPLFGRRTPCCVLGFAESASVLVESKADLRRCIAEALGKNEDEVELGPLQQLKEMMLHRSGTDESPRLGDGPWSRPDAEGRRRFCYARLPVRARTLVEVYLPGEESAAHNARGSSPSAAAAVTAEAESSSEGTTAQDAENDASRSDEDEEAEAEATILAHGWFLQEQLYKHMTDAKGRKNTSTEETKEAEEEDSDDDSAVLASVAALHDEFGVVYCEVPPVDESGFAFDQLHGKEVDADMAARVVDRWTRRVDQQQQQQRRETMA